MPDPLHLLLPHDDPARRLHVAMRAYARWRNHHRGTRGPVWAARPPAEARPNDDHARRTLRYVHLNPCRARPRSLAVRTAWYHGERRGAVLAAASGLAERSVRRTVVVVPARGAPVADPALAVCIRVVGDPRFGSLEGGDLRRLPTWARDRQKT